MSNLDRDTDTCWTCGSHGDCAHREPELRGWRSRQAWQRRADYLENTGRAEGHMYRPVIAEPVAVVTTSPESEIAPVARQREKGPDPAKPLERTRPRPAAGKFRGSARYLET